MDVDCGSLTRCGGSTESLLLLTTGGTSLDLYKPFKGQCQKDKTSLQTSSANMMLSEVGGDKKREA